jgi:hypothetical protein
MFGGNGGGVVSGALTRKGDMSANVLILCSHIQLVVDWITLTAPSISRQATTTVRPTSVIENIAETSSDQNIEFFNTPVGRPPVNNPNNQGLIITYPPTINCICEQSMSTFADMSPFLVNAPLTTPPPLPPNIVLNESDILLKGSSELMGSMRAFSDRSFTVPIRNNTYVPRALTKLYIEVATPFNYDQMSIEECRTTPSNTKLLKL